MGLGGAPQPPEARKFWAFWTLSPPILHDFWPRATNVVRVAMPIAIHTRMCRLTHFLQYGNHEDPAKSTHSKMAFSSRLCCALRLCANLGNKRASMMHSSHARISSQHMSETRAATAHVTGRVARGTGAAAAHLDDGDGHREEVDPPLGGDSARLGLEPRSHRQLRQHILLPAAGEEIFLPSTREAKTLQIGKVENGYREALSAPSSRGKSAIICHAR